MPGERVQVASSAVKEVAFFEPDTICVVPAQGQTIYRYDGFGRDTYDELISAPSVGKAWGELLRSVLEDRGETAIKLDLFDYEALFSTVEPAEYKFSELPTISYAW